LKTNWLIIPLVVAGLLMIPSIIGAEKAADVPVRMIVMFREGAEPSDHLDGDDVQMELDIINGAAIMATPSQVKAMKNNRNVVSITMDNPVEAADTAYTRLPWGVNRIDADMVWGTENEGAYSGHTGKGIDVAVLDTGIDLDHPDLINNMGSGINYVQQVNPAGKVRYYDPNSFDDDNGHGTHCAGIIAGNEAVVGHGAIGVAREATLHPVKVLDSRGSGYTSWLVSGIEWCTTHDIEVISMSLSSSVSDPNVEAACYSAYNTYGITLVAASGNYGNGDLKFDDAKEYPASYDTVISVAATDHYDKIASFSTLNDKVDIAAPGKDIYSTYIGGYATMSGTSMACPHVAGVIALMLQAGETEIKSDLVLPDNDVTNSVSLIDALLSSGGTDSNSPMIMEVTTTVAEESATITFFTDEPAYASIQYGTDPTDLSGETDPTIGLIYHTIHIPLLDSNTKYYFKIFATDANSNGGGEGLATVREFTTTGGVTPPPEVQFMHVFSISASTSTRGVNKFISANVKIVDASGSAVDGATVYIKITHEDGSTVATLSSTTATNGVASFSQKVRSSGSYTISVTNVMKTGWTYDPSSNVASYTSVTF